MVEMDANDNGSSPLPSSSPSFMCAFENNRGVINYQRSRPHYNSESIAIRFHNPNNRRQHLASRRCDGEDNNGGVSSSSSSSFSSSSSMSKCDKASNVYWYPWWKKTMFPETEMNTDDDTLNIDTDIKPTVNCNGNQPSPPESPISSISYGTLFTIANLLTKSIREMLLHETRTAAKVPKHDKRDRPMVVAISIPEGPYLPLAILTVHTLTAATLSHNNNNNSDDDGGDSSAPIPIMLPMDPEQGLDRLKHTLLDARPTLILRAGQQSHILTALRQLDVSTSARDNRYRNNDDEHGDPNGGAPLDWNPPRVLDLHDHLQTLLPTHRTQTTHPPPPPEATTSPSSTNGSHKPHPPPPHPSPPHHHQKPTPNTLSHAIYTSGSTTGRPAMCVSSLSALLHYL